MEARPHSRRTSLTPRRAWLGCLVVVTVPFLSMIVGPSSGMHDDNLVYHGPIFRWVWHTLLDGHLPLWANWNFAGQNVAGVGQGALYYPFNAVFGVFGVVTAFRIWTVFHLWVATTGAFVWSWRRWGSLPGAIVSAIGYGLNGFLVLHLAHMNFTIGVAWLPWVMVGLDLVIDRWSPKRAVVLVGSLALVVFSGHPQMLWFTLIAVSFEVLARLTRRGVGLRAWLRVCGTLALGLAVGAVDLLPQYLFGRTALRHTPSPNVAFELAASPRHLLTTVLPHIMGSAGGSPSVLARWTDTASYHEVATHTGIVVVALAAIAVVGHRRDRRVWGLLALMIFALVSALGGNTPAGRWVFDYVPLAGNFRAWARNLILLNLAASCLAGVGVQVVLASSNRQARRLAAAVGGAALALLALPLVTNLSGKEVRGGRLWVALVLPIGCLLLAAVGTCLAHRSRRVAAVRIVGACAANMAFFAATAPWRTHAMSATTATDYFAGRAPQYSAPYDSPGGTDRVISNGFDLRGPSIIRGWQLINGYDPLIQENFAQVVGVEYAGEIRGDRLWAPGWLDDVLRITTFYARDGVVPTDARWRRVGEMSGTAFVKWVCDPRLAEAYVVGDVVNDTLDGIGSRLSSPATDLTRTVYVEGDHVPPALAGRSSATAVGSVVSGSLGDHGTAHYVVQATRPGVLVVSTAYLRGWTATVNGHDVPVVRADGLVLAIPVEAGTNDVRLHFVPPGLVAGAVVSAVAVVVTIGLMVGPWVMVRRRRRAPVAATAAPPADEG